MTTRGERELAELDRLYEVSDAAARNALERYAHDEWLDVVFAQLMLSAARSLRSAGRNPSSAMIEAMMRCTKMHRAAVEMGVVDSRSKTPELIQVPS